MAKPGPKRIPTITLRNRGSWRASGRQTEPRLPVEAPDCPETMTGEAKAEWDRIVPRLMTAGVLTYVDRAILIAFCEAWSDYCDARALCRDSAGKPLVIIKTTNGNLILNPAVGARNKARHQLQSLAAVLGLSPADRSNVKSAPKPEPEDAKKRFFKGA